MEPGASQPLEPNVVSGESVWAPAVEHQLPESDNAAAAAASRKANRGMVAEKRMV